MILRYLRMHLMQWIRFQTIKWESTTADWVVPEEIYAEIDRDDVTDAELTEIQDKLDDLGKFWGCDPEIARAHSLCAFLKG